MAYEGYVRDSALGDGWTGVGSAALNGDELIKVDGEFYIADDNAPENLRAFDVFVRDSSYSDGWRWITYLRRAGLRFTNLSPASVTVIRPIGGVGSGMWEVGPYPDNLVVWAFRFAATSLSGPLVGFTWSWEHTAWTTVPLRKVSDAQIWNGYVKPDGTPAFGTGDIIDLFSVSGPLAQPSGVPFTASLAVPSGWNDDYVAALTAGDLLLAWGTPENNVALNRLRNVVLTVVTEEP